MIRRSEKRRRERECERPATTVVTIPRRARPSPALEQRQKRQQARAQAKGKTEQDKGERAHGWARAEDELDQQPKLGFLDRRRANGTPLLLFVMLAVLTGVGLARVDSRIEILDVANQITELSEDQQRLLDHKRRLEAERAYLRRPKRISETAALELGMKPAPPERIQRIEVLPAPPRTP